MIAEAQRQADLDDKHTLIGSNVTNNVDVEFDEALKTKQEVNRGQTDAGAHSSAKHIPDDSRNRDLHSLQLINKQAS